MGRPSLGLGWFLCLYRSYGKANERPGEEGAEYRCLPAREVEWIKPPVNDDAVAGDLAALFRVAVRPRQSQRSRVGMSIGEQGIDGVV